MAYTPPLYKDSGLDSLQVGDEVAINTSMSSRSYHFIFGTVKAVAASYVQVDYIDHDGPKLHRFSRSTRKQLGKTEYNWQKHEICSAQWVHGVLANEKKAADDRAERRNVRNLIEACQTEWPNTDTLEKLQAAMDAVKAYIAKHGEV